MTGWTADIIPKPRRARAEWRAATLTRHGPEARGRVEPDIRRSVRSVLVGVPRAMVPGVGDHASVNVAHREVGLAEGTFVTGMTVAALTM